MSRDLYLFYRRLLEEFMFLLDPRSKPGMTLSIDAPSYKMLYLCCIYLLVQWKDEKEIELASCWKFNVFRCR